MLDTLLQALHLKGYGVYVWSAYGLSLAALAIETFWSRAALLRQQRQLQNTSTPTT